MMIIKLITICGFTNPLNPFLIIIININGGRRMMANLEDNMARIKQIMDRIMYLFCLKYEGNLPILSILLSFDPDFI